MPATLIPKSARVNFMLNAGTNPGTGIMKKVSVSLSKIVPASDLEALGAVVDSVKNLFAKPVVDTFIITTEAIV